MVNNFDKYLKVFIKKIKNVDEYSCRVVVCLGAEAEHEVEDFELEDFKKPTFACDLRVQNINLNTFLTFKLKLCQKHANGTSAFDIFQT